MCKRKFNSFFNLLFLNVHPTDVSISYVRFLIYERRRWQQIMVFKKATCLPADSMVMLLSASGGKTSTKALLCLCKATDEFGFKSSLSKTEYTFNLMRNNRTKL